MWERLLWKVMLKVRNMLVLWKYLKEQSVSDFFKKKEVSTEKCSSEKSRETSIGLAFSRKTEQESRQLTKLALRKELHKAEILWELKLVTSHFYYHAACDIVDVFKAVFPDSNIPQGISCEPIKLSYLITFGIAPYFKQLLVEGLKKAPCVIMVFDESLNKSFIKDIWISLSVTSRIINSWLDICFQYFLDILLQKTWNWSLKRLPKI